jgi:hypothetical protein
LCEWPYNLNEINNLVIGYLIKVNRKMKKVEERDLTNLLSMYTCSRNTIEVQAEKIDIA